MPRKLYCVFIAMMCQLTLSHAQDFANNPVELSGMTNLYGDVKWADFDGDKDPDAIIAGYFTGVKVFPNNNGQLATPVEVISGDSFTYLGDYDLLDFDANGYVDIVLEGPRTVDVMLNDGNFGFTLYHTGIDFTPTGTFALSCHDIDGDADLDIVIDNQIFENHNGSWRKSIATMPPTTGLRFWGDLNSDGRIDFVHLDYSVLVPYVSKGDGIFEKKTEFGSARQDAPFFLADMDGDGDLDMFVSDTDYRYALYRNSFAQTGTVAFQKSHNFDFGGGAKVDFGDTNMDGLPDILVHGFLNNPQSTTFILENASTTSTIAFNVNNLDIPGTVSTALALVDFNNDGALDIHIGSSSSGSPVYGDHSIYLNEQAPITPAPSTPTGLQTLQNDAVILKWTAVPGKRYAIEIEKDNEILYPSGSLDDGTLMLPKGHLPFSSGQYILNNLPAGSYRWRAQTIDYASRASAFSAYQTFTIAGAPHTLSLTALDYRSVSLSWIYDGSTPDGFQIFRKSSSQAWMKAGEVPGSATSFNDNTLDENLWYEYFVKAVSGGASSAGSNSVYHFTGQFIEHEFGRNEPNIVPRTAAAADLDGDEDLDFQIVGWVDAKSQTGMKNDGAGNFSQTLFLPEGTYDNDYGALIHAGDMDSDGDIDICAYVGPSYNQKITVFTNVNGTYAKTFTSTDISSSFFQTIVKDFNNDGLMDIFYPSQVNNWSPYVYRLQYQQRDGTFTETSIKLDGSEISYRGYKVIDINLDGFLDIFFTGAGTPTKPALFAMNQSGEGFTLVETSVPSMYDLHFQDLNADGIIDLVFKHYDNRLVIQYGKGDNKYDEPIFLRAFYIGDEMRVETVDIDFNGWPELIVYDNNYLHIINNNGNGSFEVSSIEFGIQGGPGIILTDLEQDGDADMLRLGANQWQGTSTIYENQQSTPSRTNQPPSAPANVASTRAAGRTTITWNVATDDKTPSKLITYNVLIKDAGGKTWVHPGTNAAGTFRNVYQAGNAGANAFFVVTGLPAGSYTAQVQAVDATFALSAWSSPLALEVMQGADDLTVERLLLNKVKLSWTLPPSSDGVMVERKTTEGFKVIAELGAGVTEYIDDKLPYNQQFTYRVISTVNGVTAAPSNTATWNTGMWVVKDTSLPNAEKSVDVGDFTGDGKMDIVMTGFFADNQNHERVKASFESTGTGFTRQDFGNLTNPSLPVASLADLNHDGQLDIYEYGYSSTNGYMANIYQNNGNKTFSAYTNIITNSNAEILSYLDFDRDNDLDLYVGTIPSGGNPSTRLVRNTGTSYENTDIFFKACEYYSCSYQSISGDFDNDGDDDLIRSNVLYLNTPKGLSEAKVFNAGSGAYRKVDFNGDGWLDVIFIGYEYYTTSKLYENKGLDADGHLQFQETTVSLPGGSAELVEHAADFDHDGDTDLLFVGGAITVFNNDNGAFQPYTIDRFRSGGASEMIDYDQDGDLDVILTGGFSIDNSSITSVVAKVLENKIIDGGTGEINQAPAAPSNLRTLQDEQGIHLLWDAPTDDRTPSSGLTYDVVLYKGGQAMLKGMVDPNTGMRTKLTTGTSFGKLLLDLPSGNYEWKVQAVDPGFSGSAFSELHSFFALPPLPGMIDTTIYKCNRTVTLTAVGKNIKWYADVNKTTLLATGVYHPEASATVFVTQTDNGSESYPRKVVVTIYEKPNKPGTSEEIKICENVSTSVQLMGAGNDLKWYNNAGLTTAIGTGEMFSAPAPVTSSTYYLTQTIQGCESNAAVINVSKVVIDATIVYENGMLRVAETEGDFFEWFRNNGRVAFTSSTLPLNGLDGTYTVVVYKDGCYKQSKPFVVTGLPEESDAVDIFPNPASDRVFIDNVPGDYRLIVYSTEGRIMLDQKGTAGGRINFSVFNWSKGLYAVTVGFEGRKVVKRLVIE